MRLAALYTGGKDSTYAIYRAVSEGHSVEYLLTVFPQSAESYMYHFPNLHITQLQAEAMNIPQLKATSAGVREDELEDLRGLVAKIADRVDGLLTGAIASNYQRRRIERICRGFGLEVFAPLWGMDPWALLDELLDAGFEVVITAVNAAGFDAGWLGRRLDRDAVEDLRRLVERFGVSPVGEGGEMETLVLYCPLFKRRIEILKAMKIWRGDSGYLSIEEARLV
ncbi:MAG: TIGR00289 family protein [Nitrososphaerota archaeon]